MIFKSISYKKCNDENKQKKKKNTDNSQANALTYTTVFPAYIII